MSKHGAGRGLRCPRCGLRAVDLVIDTRRIRRGTVRRRRKRCSACGAEARTYETYGPDVFRELGEMDARKAMILVALDVDGTLDTSGGPVPWKVVELLHHYTPPGIVRFAVVSGSQNWPGTERTGIPSFAADPVAAALLGAAAEYPWCTVRLYVGDQESDRKAAEEAGFEFVDRADWARVVARVADAALGARAKP